jgi:divalent metal cation (Fe/Co/Zn/Cd) transporter
MVLRANFSVLTDRAVLDPIQVHRVALSVAGVRGAHHIRSRGSVDAVSVDLHVHLDPHIELRVAHEKTHEVVQALRDAFPEVSDVLIHTEPADGRERDSSRIVPGS